ncbi:NUDIX hydrolase [Bacillus sp. KH172YL63]|uniref:NUDIX hydrolase n=1 Tax=Bacillus sp. KH172YL63 TaxID=2709784 RepID=UPI0013E467DF|nr:NUDIX hydrolase [Bacillus sp. KH172YL63]BCB04298.1 DNA mismatch repair protein MutT [Bacillus sp. KH172YL63]
MDIVFKNDGDVFNYRVAAVWIEDKHILLHRQREDSYWALPGGRVVLGEPSRESLKREMLEELGVHVDVGRLLMVNENFFPYKEWNFHEMGMYYEVSTENNRLFQEGEFQGMEGDRLLYKWYPIDELNEVELYPVEAKTLLEGRSNDIHHVISSVK